MSQQEVREAKEAEGMNRSSNLNPLSTHSNFEPAGGIHLLHSCS